jgi:hypothetical protein
MIDNNDVFFFDLKRYFSVGVFCHAFINSVKFSDRIFVGSAFGNDDIDVFFGKFQAIAAAS